MSVQDRREARRRKILENSENRLNRVRGFEAESDQPTELAERSNVKFPDLEKKTSSYDASQTSDTLSEEIIHHSNRNSKSFPRKVSESELRGLTGFRSRTEESSWILSLYPLLQSLICSRKTSCVFLAIILEICMQIFPHLLIAETIFLLNYCKVKLNSGGNNSTHGGGPNQSST
ncbi:hypothetical protein GQR58_006461 [Nymphon striatum]|nr:hypothetical protein GQR58_006461 [Nymphon striatum]